MIVIRNLLLTALVFGLAMAPSLLVAGPGGSARHNLLSTKHKDTSAASVVRGDMVVGNATPAWARFPLGTANQIIASDGSDLVWYSLSGDFTLGANGVTTAAATIMRGLTAVNESQLPGSIAADDTTRCWGTDSDVCLQYDELTDNRGEWTGAAMHFAQAVEVAGLTTLTGGGTVPTGRDIALTDAPTAVTDAVNKSYSDANRVVTFNFNDNSTGFSNAKYPALNEVVVGDRDFNTNYNAGAGFAPAMTCTKLCVHVNDTTSTTGKDVVAEVCKNASCAASDLSVTITQTTGTADYYVCDTGTIVYDGINDEIATKLSTSASPGVVHIDGFMICTLDTF